MVTIPRLKSPTILLFSHSWRENNWMHTFPNGISSMWNAYSFAEDLNLFNRVRFPWAITQRASPKINSAYYQQKWPWMSMPFYYNSVFFFWINYASLNETITADVRLCLLINCWEKITSLYYLDMCVVTCFSLDYVPDLSVELFYWFAIQELKSEVCCLHW